MKKNWSTQSVKKNFEGVMQTLLEINESEVSNSAEQRVKCRRKTLIDGVRGLSIKSNGVCYRTVVLMQPRVVGDP